MLLFDRCCEHDHIARVKRRQREAVFGRGHVGQRPQRLAKPTDLDAQPRAMRFIDMLRPECSRKQRASRHVFWPRFCERAGKREQYRTPRERDHCVCVAHGITACIHNERLRRQQRFDLFEQERALLAARNQPRRRCVQNARRIFDLRQKRGDTRITCLAFSDNQRGARVLRPKASHRDPGNDQFVSGPPCGRKGRWVEPGERTFGLVEAPDQKKTPDLEVPRMCGIHPVPVLFEHYPRRFERLRGPAQVPRDQRDFGLGNDAPRAGNSLLRTEGACGLLQKGPRPDEIAELSHRDASERKSMRVVAQCNPVQRSEGITRCECARRGRDQRVHRNPAKLVTPSIRYPVLDLSRSTSDRQ